MPSHEYMLHKTIFEDTRLYESKYVNITDIVDIIAMTTFTAYGVHSQRMLGNLAQIR